MGMLLFLAFIVFVVGGTFTLGYGISSLEKRVVSRRCRMPRESRRRRVARRQRVRCRYEG